MSLVYWDSSALINALASDEVSSRLESGDNCTRMHGLVEVFHHLSGRGIPTKGGRVKVSPSQAAAAISDLVASLNIRDLDKEETLLALNDAQSRGVSGRMVHDWIHVRSAKAAGARLVLTRDPGLRDLAIKEGIASDWP